MPTLQIYFPDQKEVNELKEYAEKQGFRSTAEYIRSLYRKDKWGK